MITRDEISMQETMEFRIPEENAREYLDPSVGVSLGSIHKTVRKVEVATGDPLFARICEIDREFQKRSNGKHFFFLGWIPHRRYTKRELNDAEALQLLIMRVFEPAGEECGTVYDESTTCDICGSGAIQRSDLVLDSRSLPKGGKLAIASTIAGEIVVSSTFVKMFETHELRGAEFRPIWLLGNTLAVCPEWLQLYDTSHSLKVVHPTLAGIRPTDDDADGRFRCPLGHTIGLNLISELWISREDYENSQCDIAFTKQRVGVRRGLLRPESSLLISPRLWRVLQDSHLRGYRVEVAHLK